MSRTTYLFYDIETTGLNKCFDQVLQFAAIRTDLELHEIKRHEIFIKLRPDVMPTPKAVLVHGLTLEQMQEGVCEYEATCEIHELFNTPGTITVGYNNLAFDDEFLRFSFYRNLLPPYTHQYANNCSRMDIYPIVVLYYLFKQGALIWPKVDGKTTLKLEQLSLCNNLSVGAAHNALSDVEATIELARLLKKDQKMWDYLCGYFDKKLDLARLEKLSKSSAQYPEALLIDGSIGSAKFYQSPVIGIGPHNHYKNQTLWVSLEGDLKNSTFVNRKRLGEPPILLPFTERFSRSLSSERLKEVAENVLWLQRNRELFAERAAQYKDYKYPEVPDLDVDAALYQLGFVSDMERLQCDRFHAKSPTEKIALVDSFSPNLRAQAIRVLGRNYPHILTASHDLYKKFNSYIETVKSEKVVVNYKNEPRLTRKTALEQIEELSYAQNGSPEQNNLLGDLTKYIQSW